MVERTKTCDCGVNDSFPEPKTEGFTEKEKTVLREKVVGEHDQAAVEMALDGKRYANYGASAMTDLLYK